MTPRAPKDCRDMTEVRAEIDRIDRMLVDVIAERFGYVERAWQIKLAEKAAANVPWRNQQVIDKVRARAAEKGVPPDLCEALYEPFPWSWMGNEPAGAEPWYMQPIYTMHDGKFAGRYVRGHIRQAHTGILDYFFERYLADNARRPMPFFEWVDTVYDPDELKSTFRSKGWANRLVDSVLRRE